MTLIQSWIDSLTLLKLKNAQLFIMVTIKAIIETYKIMFVYWSWVMGLMVVCYVLPIVAPRLFLSHDTGYYLLWISDFLYEILFVAACLSTRPSIVQKNCSYFRVQWSKIGFYWLIFSLVSFSSSISCWSIFFALFFMDSVGGPKNFFLSMWYALKMTVFNFPLLVVIGFILCFPLVLMENCFYVTYLMRNIVAALFLPIGICTYANIYIKKLHDQFDLYFKPVQ